MFATSLTHWTVLYYSDPSWTQTTWLQTYYLVTHYRLGKQIHDDSTAKLFKRGKLVNSLKSINKPKTTKKSTTKIPNCLFSHRVKILVLNILLLPESKLFFLTLVIILIYTQSFLQTSQFYLQVLDEAINHAHLLYIFFNLKKIDLTSLDFLTWLLHKLVII